MAIVIEMLVAPDGQVSEPAIYRAWVRNHARLTYEQVASYFDRQESLETGPGTDELRKQMQLQLQAANHLRELRTRAGALTFSSYEPTPVRKNGEVVDLELVRHNLARDLIESFMVAANVSTAAFLKKHGWPIIERVVRAPKRWDRIREIAARFNKSLPREAQPKPLADFLLERRAADPEGFNELSLSIVKLLGAGEYALEYPDGPQTSHFGLAVDDYSHTTAPNRRFADLVIQRMLKALLSKTENPYSREELLEIASRCTKRERKARKVERTMRKIAAVYLLRDRIGEIFEGVITGANWKGVFARVKHPAAEGKVIRGEIGMDVGDQVRLRLLSVDLERGFIDFARAG
jgi:exoribonuclease-2